MQEGFRESDFEETATLALKGNRLGAVAALSAKVGSALTGYTLVGVAAEALVNRVGELALNTATARFESAGREYDDEQLRIRKLQSHIASVVSPLLQALCAELDSRMSAQAVQTARHIDSSHETLIKAIADAVATLKAPATDTNESADTGRLLEVLRMAFDRPAFRNSFANEVAHEDFIEAVEHTLIALNTGVLLDRKTKQVLQRAEIGYGVVKNAEQRARLERIVVLLEQIQEVYRAALSQSKFRQFEYNEHFYQPDWNPAVSNSIDDLTVDALGQMNLVLNAAERPLLPTSLTRDPYRPR